MTVARHARGTLRWAVCPVDERSAARAAWSDRPAVHAGRRGRRGADAEVTGGRADIGLPAGITVALEDRRRADAITAPAARRRFVVARALLRRLVVSGVPDLCAGPIAITASPSGRPVLLGREDVFLSASHTRGMVAAAVSTLGGVGIDVEPADRRELPPLHAWLHDTERVQEVGADAYTRHQRLVARWVAKEAVLKACDLAVTRRQVVVHRGRDGHGVAVLHDHDDLPGPVMTLRWVQIGSGFVLAVGIGARPATGGADRHRHPRSRDNEVVTASSIRISDAC